MDVLPVLDLMSGQVVRGVAGRRSEYRPVQSAICESSRPGDVAATFARQFGFREAYVADLDAIAGGEPDWRSYEAIAAAGLAIWLDAGLGNVDRARRLIDFHLATGCLSQMILGLESLAGPPALTDLVTACDAGRLVFSLDLKSGQPLTAGGGWQGMRPEEIAAAVVGQGISSLILLDLANVGAYQGTSTGELCQSLRRRFPRIQLIGGGGIRSIDNVRQLRALGFDRVLVASALHDGRMTPADLSA